jgi:hypothetical protein
MEAPEQIADSLAAAWRRRAGVDPLELLVEGAAPFLVTQSEEQLGVTSHVTGSTYLLDLPISDDALDAWLEEIVAGDVYLFEHEPD